MSSSKLIVLKSSDGETFEVEGAVALESQTIKNMIEDGYTRIPLPNITSKILSKIIEYCKKQVQASVSDNKTVQDDLKSLDAEFVKVDQGTLIDLIQTVANMIKGISSPEEIPNFFDIENDFTPDEEEAVRRENAWAFG